MINYSVSIAVDRPIVDEWQDWMLDKHIPDVMATGNFCDHRFARVVDPGPTDDRVAFRIDYLCKSIDDYERYRVEHANALQREHTQKYEGRFAASRQILATIPDPDSN